MANSQDGEVFQFVDGLFPSGAFTHSFGLETLVQEQWITDELSSREWIRAIVRHSWVRSDALAAQLVYRASHDVSFWTQVRKIDGYLTASRASEESRQGSLNIGRRILLTASELFQDSDLPKYQEAVRHAPHLGNQAVVLAVIGVIRKWGEGLGMQAQAYMALSAMVQVLVRLVPLGQRSSQKMLFDLHGWTMEVLTEIKDLQVEDIGSGMPLYEVAQMRHRDLYSRLFRS